MGLTTHSPAQSRARYQPCLQTTACGWDHTTSSETAQISAPSPRARHLILKVGDERHSLSLDHADVQLQHQLQSPLLLGRLSTPAARIEERRQILQAGPWRCWSSPGTHQSLPRCCRSVKVKPGLLLRAARRCRQESHSTCLHW